MFFKQFIIFIILIYISILIKKSSTEDISGCGGFLKSHADIDFTKVHVKLYTKSGSLKDQTECAPNTGYYFLPIYDNGEYVLKVDPPRGWSFEPTEVLLNVDGSTDACSQGQDINFSFKGFGITGKVSTFGSNIGPKGVTVSLYNENNQETLVGQTTTSEGGTFYFTPIQPGKYLLTITHPKWIIKKSSVKAIVREGNTELLDDSLVVYGYDVTGHVTSENEPVNGVSFILFGNGQAQNCNTSPVKGFESKNFICYVTSDQSGTFTFPALTPGNYKLKPHYADAKTKFDVQPQELSFSVAHNSLILPNAFKVTGFTVSGIVQSYKNGGALAGVKIILSGKQVTITNENGRYVLDNMKAGQYVLTAESADMKFDEKQVKISPSSSELPILIPLAYKVCGKVTLSRKDIVNDRKITVKNIAGTLSKVIDINPKTGEFCEYLLPDQYQLSVIVSAEEKAKGLQFFPLQQNIDVSSKSLSDINFLQLKALLKGTVKCLAGSDCSSASITLKALDGIKIKTVDTKDGRYEFSDVLPGQYEVFIDNDIFCWESASHKVSITSERAEVPVFQQTGFSVIFISSHDTTVEFNEPDTSKKTVWELTKGSTRHCVSKPGEYSFSPNSCHVYTESNFKWNSHYPSPIILSSTEHRHKGSIVSNSGLNNIEIKIENSGHSVTLGPLKYIKMNNTYKYEFEFKAKTDNMYELTPLSDILLFNPPSLKVLGINDCHNDVVTFYGDKGKIISGKISPTLEGVTVKIFGSDKENPIHTIITEKDGKYNLGPLDGKMDYKVTAEKEGFVISGPDADGLFLAHKLADIIVETLDQSDKSPLQGVVLSLSGGKNYRKNSMTSAEGMLTFNSLSPGEYYLKPMMKEYRFDPSSNMINVVEGGSIKVNYFGKRVAFSVYGHVSSLNGEGESGLLVEAQGLGNCSNLQEEATTEDNGSFRIRGLQPSCTYAVRLKAKAEANNHIHRASPESLTVQAVQDITDLRLIVFHPISRTDVSVHIVSTQPEHYRTLKVKLCRDDMPDSPIHVTKLDSPHSNKYSNYNAGLLVNFPPLQADGKKYFIQLESSLSQNSHKYRTIPVYFETNSSFKAVKLLFNAEPKVDQADMNQTSVVALPFILLVAFTFFNREKVWNWLNTLIEKWSKPAPTIRAPVQAIPIDPRADDIIVEQIMNINKRKIKPRKT